MTLPVQLPLDERELDRLVRIVSGFTRMRPDAIRAQLIRNYHNARDRHNGLRAR